MIVRISATRPWLAGMTIVVVRRLRRLLRGSLLARDGLLVRLLRCLLRAELFTPGFGGLGLLLLLQRRQPRLGLLVGLLRRLLCGLLRSPLLTPRFLGFGLLLLLQRRQPRLSLLVRLV